MKQIALIFSLAIVACAGPESRKAADTGPGTQKADVPVGLEEGQQAPDIVMSTPQGEELSLHSLRGKVVLLDFWAAWCGPCRKENPNIVEQYQRYKDKGFTIYSVSLDLKKEDWVRAIEKDKLAWPNHVSDLKFWYSEAATAYKIDAIPANFLLDENGVIIGKNLFGAQLASRLSELFSK